MKTSLQTSTVAALLLTFAWPLVAQTPPTNGLQLWLQADALTGLNHGDKIASWPDSSGNGYAATNGNAATQPQFATNVLNGLPAVRFQDSGPNWLSSTLPLNANSNDVTTLVVFRLDPGELQARDHILQPAGTTGSTWLWVMPPVGGTNLDLIGNFNGAPLLSAHRPYFRGAWTIVSQVQDTTAMHFSLYRDGVLEGDVAFTTAALPSSGWVLGLNKNLNNNGLNGYVAEVLIYQGALDPVTRRAAEEYLAGKYGMTLRQNLLTDTFNTADGFDLEADLATRQTGDLAPITNTPAFYSQQQSLSDYAEIKAQALVLNRLDDTDFNPDKRLLVSPNLNFRPFEVNGSFRVTADIVASSTSTDPTPDAWSGITLSADQLIGPIPANGFALLVRPGGAWQAFDGPYSIGGGSTLGATNYRVAVDVQGGGLTAFINGVPVVANHLLTNAAVGNFVTLSGYSATNGVPAVSRFDNLVVSVLPEAVLSATVILADTYDTADTNDLDADLLARQTGLVAPTGYLSATNNGATVEILGSQIKVTNPDNVLSVGVFCPAVDFLPYERFQNFRLRFKVSPTVTGAADSWAGLKIRDNSLTTVATGTGFSFLIKPDGGWTAFQGTTLLNNGAVATASVYAFDLDVRTNLLKLKINDAPVLTQAMPGSATANYVSLMSFASTALGGPTGVSATFDDFEFAALGAAASVPAPVLSNAVFTGTAAGFQFDSVNGVVYIVEYKDDLAAPVWTILGNALGNGATVTVTDNTVNGDQRFYRLRVP